MLDTFIISTFSTFHSTAFIKLAFWCFSFVPGHMLTQMVPVQKDQSCLHVSTAGPSFIFSPATENKSDPWTVCVVTVPGPSVLCCFQSDMTQLRTGPGEFNVYYLIAQTCLLSTIIVEFSRKCWLWRVVLISLTNIVYLTVIDGRDNNFSSRLLTHNSHWWFSYSLVGKKKKKKEEEKDISIQPIFYINPRIWFPSSWLNADVSLV